MKHMEDKTLDELKQEIESLKQSVATNQTFQQQEQEMFQRINNLEQEYIQAGGHPEKFDYFLEVYGHDVDPFAINEYDDLFFDGEHSPTSFRDNLTNAPKLEPMVPKIEHPMDEYYEPGTTIRKRRH